MSTSSSASTPPSGFFLDFRSDTFTKPTSEMRQAMAAAKVGDDVYGEDPTVNELEAYVAQLTGKEAALFLPTCTMANLLSIMSHCNSRFSEIIIGQQQHIVCYEAGNASTIAGVQPWMIGNELDGTIDLEKVKKAIRETDVHFPNTKLICVENTHNKMGGRVLKLDYLEKLAALAKEKGIKVHMDGARLFNAVAALDTTAKEICKHVDSVSICLSKGLSGPAGALLCGDKQFIALARHGRKAIGGGMRQSGVLAACGLVALQVMSKRLGEDNAHMKKLAQGIDELGDFFTIKGGLESVETNMMYLDVKDGKAKVLAAELKSNYGILVDTSYGDCSIRLVTHVDVPSSNADYVIDSFRRAARTVFNLKPEEN